MQTVERTLSLLEYLSEFKDGVGVNEISNHLDLPLSTTHRLLTALKNNGYVSQDYLTRRYSLGIGVLTLAVKLLNEMDIVQIAKPMLSELSTKYGQLVYISVLKNNKVICVDMVNNAKNMRYFVQIGTSMPTYCAASAKAVVAYQDEDLINRIIDNEKFHPFTKRTLISKDMVIEELKKVENQGYAICDEEMEEGVQAIATPIRDREGKVVASVTLMLMGKYHYNLEQLVFDMKETSLSISRYLGYIQS